MKIPTTYRNANQYPQPLSEAPLLAPNKQSEVQRTIDEHPEIDTMDDAARGEILDITDRRINPGGGEKPWGRKARNNDPNNPNLNTDGMTWLRYDTQFEIYDAISGTDGQSSWEGYGPYSAGENGYWWPPNEVENGGEDGGGGTGELADLEQRVAVLESQVAELTTKCTGLDERLGIIEGVLDEGLHAHGPVDLPIVVESLTRMRAKGDIDVEVKPGPATPPASSGESFDLVDLVVLRRLLDRPDEGKGRR